MSIENKMTDKQLQTEVVIILDRSGSMKCIAKPTVDGFNSFIDEQKNAEGEAFITLVQFDDRYEINYKSVPVLDVQKLILNETFIPRGTTALLDAIGKTIEEIDTERDVVVVIITDGHENSSYVYKHEAINKIIETKRADGWKFIFLGANQDAIKTGSSLGVEISNSLTYDASASSVQSTFINISANMSKYRSSKMNLDMDAAKNLIFSDEQRKNSRNNE